MWQKLDYIHNNPVKAGLVHKAEEYVYSSATELCLWQTGWQSKSGFIKPCANDIRLLTIMELFGGFFKAGCSKNNVYP